MPNLEKLDNACVTTEEWMAAKKLDLQTIENEEIVRPQSVMEEWEERKLPESKTN